MVSSKLFIPDRSGSLLSIVSHLYSPNNLWLFKQKDQFEPLEDGYNTKYEGFAFDLLDSSTENGFTVFSIGHQMKRAPN